MSAAAVLQWMQMPYKQLLRLYHQCYDRMNGDPGWPDYGWDWPTLRMVKPGWYRVLKLMSAVIRLRNIHEIQSRADQS